MNQPQREFLSKCHRGIVIVNSGDPRWELIAELQKTGLARLEWSTGTRLQGRKPSQSARIVPTDKGVAELARGQG